MAEGPTDRVVNDANNTGTVYDTRERQISVRFPSSFLRMRLARYIGSELQANQEWWGNAIIALSVTMIGEVPVPEARNADQVESTIYKLDEDGMLAVAMWLKAESEKRSDNMAATAKN
jgi:hypothetical protein